MWGDTKVKVGMVEKRLRFYGRERKKAMNWEGNVDGNVDGELLGDWQMVKLTLEKR
jgi:hypothetical protein